MPNIKPHQQKDIFDKKLFGATNSGHPSWSFQDSHPFDKANTIAEYVYPDLTWTVTYPDGRRRAERIKGLTWQEQTIYPGDKVVVTDPRHPECVTSNALESAQFQSGRVIYILRMLRAAIVAGINEGFAPTSSPNQLIKTPMPISLDSLSLLDERTQQPTKAEWRRDESGELVRVSLTTGRILPLPAEWETLDDLTVPSKYLPSPEFNLDTGESALLANTYQPSCSTFEEEIEAEMKLAKLGPRSKTFWY